MISSEVGGQGGATTSEGGGQEDTREGLVLECAREGVKQGSDEAKTGQPGSSSRLQDTGQSCYQIEISPEFGSFSGAFWGTFDKN